MFKYHTDKNKQIDEEMDYAKNDTRQIELSQSEASKNWRLQIPQAFRRNSAGIPSTFRHGIIFRRGIPAESLRNR